MPIFVCDVGCGGLQHGGLLRDGHRDSSRSCSLDYLSLYVCCVGCGGLQHGGLLCDGHRDGAGGHPAGHGSGSCFRTGNNIFLTLPCCVEVLVFFMHAALNIVVRK
jgi:hypothetical protein